jgi:rare lipoprotein A
MNKRLLILAAALLTAACAQSSNQRVKIRSATTFMDDGQESSTDVASELKRIDAEERARAAEEKLAKEKAAAEQAARDAESRAAEEAQRQAQQQDQPEPQPEPQTQPEPQPQPQQAQASPVDVSATAFGAVCSYKIGNPYLIEGVSYYPHEDYTYSEIGIASWYGPNFHGGNTANGEVFDEKRYTAAHRTLPMPSLVRVTNLENGVSLNVKINDRGPFARDRILDLSSAAADVLGIKERGSARVRVDILEAESRNMKELAMACQGTDNFEPNVSFAPREQAAPVYQEPAMESAAAPIGGEGDYFVQVAAYSSYDKAEELRQKISDIATVKIFKAKQGEGVLYKVRLGEFATKDEAERVKSAVDRAGIAGSRVIKREAGSFDWNP